MKQLLCLQLLFLPLMLQAQAMKYVVPPDNDYFSISNYSDGLAKVELKGDSTGFIDRNGEMVFTINYPYNDVGNFYDGRAFVRKEINGKRKYGYINKNGKMVVPFQYSEAKDFSSDRAVVYKNYWQVINRHGKTIIGDSLLITEIHNDRGGYDVEPPSFCSGLMLSRKNERYGYVDTIGNPVVPFHYLQGTDFNEGVALVASLKPEESVEDFGALEKMYDNLANGHTEASNWQWHFIDKKGKIIYTFLENQFPQMNRSLCQGTIVFRQEAKDQNSKSNNYGIMSKAGEIIVPPDYNSNLFGFSDDLAIIRIQGDKSDNSDGYMLIINKEGKIVGNCPFDTPYGVIYDSKFYFHEGLLAVKIKTKDSDYRWGYINKKGGFVIKPQFNKALNFYENRAVVVTKNGQVAVIKNPLRKEK